MLVLNTGFHARMGDVIVVADFTKRIAATFQSTVSTYCCSAVGALGDGRLTAPRSRVAIAGHKFNLAFRHQRTLNRMSASEEPAPFKPFFAAHAISGLGSESPGVCYKAWAEPGL